MTISQLVRQMVSRSLEEERPRRRALMDICGIGKGPGRDLKPLDRELYESEA